MCEVILVYWDIVRTWLDSDLIEKDSEGSSSKTEYEDKPKLMTMLLVILCVPSGHCRAV